jgi:hypothetical protein
VRSRESLRGGEVYQLQERRRNTDPRFHTYRWEKMSCFGCFKKENKMPPRRIESREVAVVKTAPSQNEALPRESGKMLLPGISMFCTVQTGSTKKKDYIPGAMSANRPNN